MKSTLILGIGNILMGDEGIGVHVARRLEEGNHLPADVVDGGTGGFQLLDYFHQYKRVILVDATIDGKPPGTISVLHPKYSSDYPPTLTAHDIGLKDLLDALYLMNRQPEIVLVTVSIRNLDQVTMELSPRIEESIPDAIKQITKFVKEG